MSTRRPSPRRSRWRRKEWPRLGVELMSVADRLGLMWLCVNVHFGSGQRYSPFPFGRFRRPLHRSTYTSTSSGASPAELASPLNGCVPLAAPIRSAVSHCWSSSSRVAAFRSRSRANRCMLSTSSFANSRAILRRRNTDFSSCADFAKWPPNRMRLSSSARHSMPSPCSSRLIHSVETLGGRGDD